MTPLQGRAWTMGCLVVFGLALLATVPTTGDLGLTWDEPAYRYSQLLSEQWWARLARARSAEELSALMHPDALLYHWPYGRFGFNFHPPLAGQANLLAYEVLGGWIKDIPARRMASVLEFAGTLAILFGFLARRYGAWVGGIAAAGLLTMPRVYGDGHIASTDTPGLLLWAMTAVAFWNGLHAGRGGGRWRILVGVLVGLAFVEKMAAVMVLIPLIGWLVAGRLLPLLARKGARADWIDGLATSVLQLLPLAIAYAEIRRLAGLLPAPVATNLFVDRPPSPLPGAILAAPLGVWLARRLLARLFPSSRVWGTERPGLEIWAAILAFGPLIAWLGNPAWWRETMPRLAHYYLLNTDRAGSLPDIRIIYFGRTYFYSLPWHNAWVLIGVTVPIGLLAAGVAGILFALARLRRDRLPFYFLVHFATWPILRMLPTPAHDGVRLILPSFFFLAGLAAWGVVGLGDLISRQSTSTPGPDRRSIPWATLVLGGIVLGNSAWALARVHPYELSYYNELIGGPRGAWHRGMDLSYWFDAYNGPTLRAINDRLPPSAYLGPPNQDENVPTFPELQSLGELRPDIRMGEEPDRAFPHEWLLTHDSKANAFSRLLFAMTPWYASAPGQLDGLRVATIAEPTSVSRAWSLSIIADGAQVEPPKVVAPLPGWARSALPFVARFWGEGLTPAPLPVIREQALGWAQEDPASLRRAAAAMIAQRRDDPDAVRLRRLITRDGNAAFESGLNTLLRSRPEALAEAVEILIRRPEAVRAVLLRQGYTDPETIGGYLDRDVAQSEPAAAP